MKSVSPRYSTTTPLKQLSAALRPRERMQKYGPDYVELHELIAVILRTGLKGRNVLDLAQEVSQVFTAKNYQNITIADLVTIPGISSTKATEIIAAYELGKRIQIMVKSTHQSIESPEDCLPYLMDISHARKEHFVVLYLDTKNCLIQKEIISIGTLDSSLVHPREVFEPAYRHSSARIILSHNHPSGNPEPSEEDIIITRQLIRAGEILGISVLDHIIVAKNNFEFLSDPRFEIF